MSFISLLIYLKCFLRLAVALRKGTVCDGLKKRYGLVHISPGQILRDEVSKESELGLKAAGSASGKFAHTHTQLSAITSSKTPQVQQETL